MRNELGKAECHVRAGVGAAEILTIDAAHERQMDLAVAPRRAQFVRCDRDW
jgi:hypothetical protein